MTPASSAVSAATGAVTQAASATHPSSSQASSSAEGGSFASLFGAGLNQASHLEAQAQSTVMNLLRGNGVEVHDAMIATQQSELTFELALQVRNKAVAAYQQMMQMQF